MLELAFADGQVAGLARHKVAWMSATHPVVSESAVLKPSGSTEPKAPIPPAPTTPDTLKQTFNLHEQGETRVEPRRKLSEELCTTCRKPKHYGPCKRPVAIKKSDFNLGLTANDAPTENPSTSPHYHSATSDSALARARDARPADEQAGTAFADLYRHLGISSAADEPGRMSGGLNKVSALNQELQGIQQLLHGGVSPHGALEVMYPHAAQHLQPHAIEDIYPGLAQAAANRVRAHDLGREAARLLSPKNPTPLLGHAPAQQMIQEGVRLRAPQKLGNFMLPGIETHSSYEQRGPSPNPYEERLTIKSPPLGFGDEGPQRIRRAFDQIDGAVDSTSIEDSAKGPQPGPLA